MKFSAVLLLGLTASSSAFAPSQHAFSRADVSLEMANGERRAKLKKALKSVGKVAGAFGTLAIATTGLPSSAVAARKVAEVADKAQDMKKVYVAAAAAFGAGTLATRVFTGTAEETAMVKKINSVFSGAMKNKDLVSAVSSSLKPYGYGETSLIATSLCVDEISRPLEDEFVKVYKDNFSMGGLAGFPFGGVTAFGAMASHIPDGGSCLVVFGPHVGVDSDGAVGTVARRGRANGGACCGSGVAASNYVASVHSGKAEKAAAPTEPKDAQQSFVGSMLLPHAARLESAKDKMVELPYALYDAQKKLMDSIIQAGCGAVAGEGKIAVLGGIQVNTPPGESDYFLPLSFELFDNKGNKKEDLMFTL